jgi:hypothetical protein
MLIDYSATRTFTQTLQIDDIGNCAIHGEGSFRDGRVVFPGDYYMIVKTIMGKTTFIKWGPLMTDFTALPNTFKLEVKTAAYKEATVLKEIQSFINDGMKGITEAEALQVEEVLEYLPTQINFTETLA